MPQVLSQPAVAPVAASELAANCRDERLLPSHMSIPEIMGDPCASELRDHALALIHAADSSAKLIRSHPRIAEDLAALRESVRGRTSAILDRLADEAGLPAEGQSISKTGGSVGDYRIDQGGKGCWIWMRSVNPTGYPISGRKGARTENVAAKIYWMLARGRLREGEIVTRTCGLRLCVNPDHGHVTDRTSHGAAQMQDHHSPLDWDAVHEIRTTLAEGTGDIRRITADLAARFRVTKHTIRTVFRNKSWTDPDYTPGWEVACRTPGCDVVFRTSSAVQKYHSTECQAAATRARQSRDRLPQRSPERQAREEAALQAEADAAAVWVDGVSIDESRSSVWPVASMDQPIGDTGGTLADVVPSSDGDPSAELERKLVHELTGDLTEEIVAAMGEPELSSIRARLAAADIYPSTSRYVR